MWSRCCPSLPSSNLDSIRELTPFSLADWQTPCPFECLLPCSTPPRSAFIVSPFCHALYQGHLVVRPRCPNPRSIHLWFDDLLSLSLVWLPPHISTFHGLTLLNSMHLWEVSMTKPIVRWVGCNGPSPRYDVFFLFFILLSGPIRVYEHSL